MKNVINDSNHLNTFKSLLTPSTSSSRQLEIWINSLPKFIGILCSREML